jgi:hypothetical protein
VSEPRENARETREAQHKNHDTRNSTQRVLAGARVVCRCKQERE